MIQLSEHFNLPEFEDGDLAPAVAIPSFASLCELILEPVRVVVGPMIITSGYRSPASNRSAHGQPDSEHVATSDYCAVDFYAVHMDARKVFDWMRVSSTLPFHQLILEHGRSTSIVHVSWNRLKPGVRSVLEGATHNSEPYVKVDHVSYQPESNHDAVQDAEMGE